MKALYLLGAAGVGKSTVMGRLLADYTPLDYARLHGVLRGHPLVDADGDVSALYLGRRRSLFPGTDALSMSVHPDAVEWASRWSGVPFRTIFAEGQRLGTVGFLTTLGARGALTVVHLVAPEDVLQARRDGRGSAQNPQWVKGSRTKAYRTAEGARDAGLRVVEVDAGRPLDEVMDDVERAWS